MTEKKDKRETRGKGAPEDRVPLDPRVKAFVRMLARRAAEQDYARLLETHGKAHDPLSGKD